MKTITLILFLGIYAHCFAQESSLYPTFEQNTKLVLKLLDTLKNQFNTTYKFLHINDAIYHETFIYHDKRLDSFARLHNLFVETSHMPALFTFRERMCMLPEGSILQRFHFHHAMPSFGKMEY